MGSWEHGVYVCSGCFDKTLFLHKKAHLYEDNSLVANLGAGSTCLTGKTHLRTISQGFVQNTTH